MKCMTDGKVVVDLAYLAASLLSFLSLDSSVPVGLDFIYHLW